MENPRPEHPCPMCQQNDWTLASYYTICLITPGFLLSETKDNDRPFRVHSTVNALPYQCRSCAFIALYAEHRDRL